MKRKSSKVAIDRHKLLLIVTCLGVLVWLLLYKLGSLTGGLSQVEHQAVATPVGLSNLYHDPFYLPLKLLRLLDFSLLGTHSQLLARLPNVFFGALTVISFGWLIRLWHGRRTALFALSLFATGAWILHASRLASFDVLYLWAIPTLLVIHIQLQRNFKKAWVFYGSLAVWGAMLYIPGLVWLVLVAMIAGRQGIADGWSFHKGFWRKLLYLFLGVIWLPLLAVNLSHLTNLRLWLGLPTQLAAPLTLAKQFAAVFAHLFVRGPANPQLWLPKAPILDIFTLSMCLIGIYFYGKHWQAPRSRLLSILFIMGAVLVSLGGPVGLSLLVPVLYLVAATGIAYLLREWLKVFPVNPLARRVGLALIILAVSLACLYNLRAYFVAWPHAVSTPAVFRYHL